MAAAIPLSAPLVVGQAIRSTIDFLSLFRVDVSLKYKDLTIGDLALIAAVSGALTASGVNVYNTALLPPTPFSIKSTVLDRLGKLNTCHDALGRAQKDVARLAIQLKQQIDELTTKMEAAAGVPPKEIGLLKQERDARQAALDQLVAADTRLTACSGAFTAFRSALLKTDDNTGLNALPRLLRAEKLAAVAGDDCYTLLLKLAAASGGYKTRQSRFCSGELLYSGGAIVEFVLFDPSGQIADAATMPSYTGFIKVKERSEAVDLEEV